MNDSHYQRISISLGSWMKLALVAILAYALFQITHIIMVLLVALVISAAIEPILRGAKHRGVPRLLSVITVYAGAALFLSIFFYILLLPLIGEVSSFVKTLTIYSNSVVNDSVLSSMFANQHVFGGIQTPAIMEQLTGYLNSFSDFLSQGIFSTASSVFGGVLSFVLIIVLSFYLAVQDDGVAKFLKVIIPLNYEDYAVSLWRRSQLKIGFWMQGQLILGLTVALMVYIGLMIMGVPNALLFAVLAGIFEIIPIFGPILSAIPGIFSAYSALGATEALIVAAIYLVVQQLENHLLYPLVVKKVVGVPPMVSIVAIFIGGELAGFLGILISVPLAVIAMELLSDLEQKKLTSTNQS